MTFKGSMQAKEFLVSRIAAEAQRAQVPLSELEQKELYFSENYPTLPNMLEIDEQFEAQVDSQEFEDRIRKLSRQAFSHDSMESPEMAERWREAVRRLETEDHYILVVLDLPRPASDVAKLFAAGIAVTVTGVAAVAALNWAGGNGLSRIPDRVKWIAFGCLLVIAAVFSYTRTGKKVGDSIGEAIERVGKWLGMK